MIAAPPAKVIASIEKARQNSEFNFQGEYVSAQKGIQVIALGKGEFQAVIYTGGLPGAGWDLNAVQKFDGNRDDVTDIIEDMKKVHRQSSTLGLKAPAGAVVLFDGTQQTLDKQWKQGAKIEAGQNPSDGLLVQGATSVETFRDFSVHVEFRLPFMPEARGQARGNSGAYYQGRYETQILDSFGLTGEDNECGGIYEIRKPDLNMCFPPLSWQTYDVDFTAARYDKSGKKISNAKVTVKLNGVTVHDDVDVPRSTRASPFKEEDTPGPFYLQDHGNPVRFKNIWILPRDSRAHAKRPRVPAFERFYARADQDQIAGGRLLLGELNCISCHQADGNWSKSLMPKQAPRLTGIGNRVHAKFLEDFVLSPHDFKPGSTMPTLLAGLTEQQRHEQLEPIIHFLASTGKVSQQPLDRQAVERGKKAFHTIGCAICHGRQQENSDSENATASATSIPLGPLHKKYGILALRDFLKNPHAIRPSGRMPAMHLDDKQASDLAHYLLRESQPELTAPKVLYKTYLGDWDNLPRFDKLKPAQQGKTTAFNVYVAGKTDQFAIVFTGWITAQKAGNYRFHLGSDDGSRLLVDGKEVVLNDGVHPHSFKTGEQELQVGSHEIRVEYFEKGGEESLQLDIEGPSLSRQDISNLIRTTQQEKKPEEKETNPDQFRLNPSLVELGKERFSKLGCANCHEMKLHEKTLASSKQGQALSKLNPTNGCLAEKVPASLPQYNLSNEQRLAIRAAMIAGPDSQDKTPQQLTHQVMATLNCYACHRRDEIGGAELARNELFVATIPEMGDEGRIPPPLDGVADKLQESWLKKVLHDGSQDRPYLLTRMPKFNSADVDRLANALIKQDRKSESEVPILEEPPHRIKAIGQELVSGKALSCIKCHTFAQYPATGIQAISMTIMQQRLREDWFHRYLVDPQKYRPGTRMPNSFPNGVSAKRDILGGDPHQQIAAMWEYLKDGEKAGIPSGLLPDPIELVPVDRPRIYRNFIQGTSPRGIAVGYPEHLNIAWDSQDLCMKLIWHGRFIDAAKHWRGRGQGTQRPLGVHVMPIEKQVPWAISSTGIASWPSESAAQRGYHFSGYKLDQQKRPVFLYENEQCNFSEQIIPLPKSESEADLKRIFRVTPTGENLEGNVSFLVASGKEIEISIAAGKEIEILKDITIQVDGALNISIQVSGDRKRKFRMIKQDGMTYVVMDFNLNEISDKNPLEIIQTIRW